MQKRVIAASRRIMVRPEAYLMRLVVEPLYKLRVGDYRILVLLEQNTILVVKIGLMKVIYKQ